ncbi:MAG: CRISPR-associated endonuclease Cas6 [Bacteroidota bacterium]
MKPSLIISAPAHNNPNQTILRQSLLCFSLPLEVADLSRFRASVAEKAGWEQDLFHNHQSGKSPANGKVINRYPLVQYRLYQGHAAMLGYNEGALAVSRFLADYDGTLYLKGEDLKLPIRDFRQRTWELKASTQSLQYRLKDWIALNQRNYHRWQTAPSDIARKQLLERILTAHLLAFAKAMHWDIDWTLQIEIQEIERTKQTRYRNVSLLAFDIRYTANLCIPANIGLGKSVSEGYGRNQLWRSTS